MPVKTAINTAGAPKAIGPYSQGISVGPFVYVSGQLGLDPATGKMKGATAVEQAEQALRNIGAVLEAAGLGMKDVVKTTILMKDLGEFAAVNEVYARHFIGVFPARATYEVARLPLDALVEIEAVAVSD
jgi:reactive intermediate/imine deaminase